MQETLIDEPSLNTLFQAAWQHPQSDDHRNAYCDQLRKAHAHASLFHLFQSHENTPPSLSTPRALQTAPDFAHLVEILQTAIIIHPRLVQTLITKLQSDQLKKAYQSLYGLPFPELSTLLQTPCSIPSQCLRNLLFPKNWPWNLCLSAFFCQDQDETLALIANLCPPGFFPSQISALSLGALKTTYRTVSEPNLFAYIFDYTLKNPSNPSEDSITHTIERNFRFLANLKSLRDMWQHHVNRPIPFQNKMLPPLYLAAHCVLPYMTTKLLALGADPTIKTTDDQNIWFFAQGQSMNTILRYYTRSSHFVIRNAIIKAQELELPADVLNLIATMPDDSAKKLLETNFLHPNSSRTIPLIHHLERIITSPTPYDHSTLKTLVDHTPLSLMHDHSIMQYAARLTCTKTVEYIWKSIHTKSLHSPEYPRSSIIATFLGDHKKENSPYMISKKHPEVHEFFKKWHKIDITPLPKGFQPTQMLHPNYDNHLMRSYLEDTPSLLPSESLFFLISHLTKEPNYLHLNVIIAEKLRILTQHPPLRATLSANIDAIQDGTTALLRCAQYDYYSFASLLLPLQPSLQKTDPKRKNLLHFIHTSEDFDTFDNACSPEQKTALRTLIAQQDLSGISPLMRAAQKAQLSIAEQTESTPAAPSPTLFAKLMAICASSAIIQPHQHAFIWRKDARENTLLHHAALSDHPENIYLLIHRIQCIAKGKNLNNLELYQIIMEAQNLSGETALDVAFKGNKHNALQALNVRCNELNPDHKLNHTPFTPFTFRERSARAVHFFKRCLAFGRKCWHRCQVFFSSIYLFPRALSPASPPHEISPLPAKNLSTSTTPPSPKTSNDQPSTMSDHNMHRSTIKFPFHKHRALAPLTKHHTICPLS